MVASITVYTRTTCPYCELLKKFLDSKNVNYKTINMEENSSSMQEVLNLTGQTIAPTTVFETSEGKKEVVVGFNLARIVPAIT